MLLIKKKRFTFILLDFRRYIANKHYNITYKNSSVYMLRFHVQITEPISTKFDIEIVLTLRNNIGDDAEGHLVL